MSVFSPTVKVTAPNGSEWEIYAYKLPLRRHREPKPIAGKRRRQRLAERLRGLRAVGGSWRRALLSDEWTVEAIVRLPQPESYAWITTREYRGQVLAQVEGHLARGYVPQRLAHTTFLGAANPGRRAR